jgi:glycosyltransferase involved in cell wall biosynthesis
VLWIEPFDGGSHAAFTRALLRHGDVAWTPLTLPGRHWKWRMRGASAWFATHARHELLRPHDVLMCSSYLALADLVGMVPALAAIPKVVWFHENQWAYPVREERERDRHFGFTQVISAASADLCLFNSAHNQDSFLEGTAEVLRTMPDARPAGLVERVAARCEVMSFPMEFPHVPEECLTDVAPGPARRDGPLILWNHRWEHDKDPETFFETLRELLCAEVPFRVIVCGERFAETPCVFDRARQLLGGRVEHWGMAETREEYAALLARAQIVVSTARHEFFGVSVLEAVDAGAFPLVPDRLAYPELLPAGFRYRDSEELAERLRDLCLDWVAGRTDLRADRRSLTRRFAAERVVPELVARLRALRDQRAAGSAPE